MLNIQRQVVLKGYVHYDTFNLSCPWLLLRRREPGPSMRCKNWLYSFLSMCASQFGLQKAAVALGDYIIAVNEVTLLG